MSSIGVDLCFFFSLSKRLIYGALYVNRYYVDNAAKFMTNIKKGSRSMNKCETVFDKLRSLLTESIKHNGIRLKFSEINYKVRFSRKIETNDKAHNFLINKYRLPLIRHCRIMI